MKISEGKLRSQLNKDSCNQGFHLMLFYLNLFPLILSVFIYISTFFFDFNKDKETNFASVFHHSFLLASMLHDKIFATLCRHLHAIGA